MPRCLAACREVVSFPRRQQKRATRRPRPCRLPVRARTCSTRAARSATTIGQGDSIGPDLLNVVIKRDREWLIRWLQEPDVMLEEKDPLATALYAQYNNVPMPNVKLTYVDALNPDDIHVYRKPAHKRDGRTYGHANRQPGEHYTHRTGCRYQQRDTSSGQQQIAESGAGRCRCCTGQLSLSESSRQYG